jgi:hypothetical protein
MNQPINCPSCGATLRLQLHAAKMVVCHYCGQTSFLNAGRWQAQGEKTVLADYGSLLALGRTGKLKGKPFRVLGRVRMSYEGGFWDEWLLQLDNGTTGWLQEDEGDFVLFMPSHQSGVLPTYPSLKVGKTYKVGEYIFFVMEKNQMKVLGSEGELPYQVLPGHAGAYVEGVSVGKGKPISLEYLGDEIALNLGTDIDIKQIELDKQAEYV